MQGNVIGDKTMSVEDRTGHKYGVVNSTGVEGKGEDYYKSRFFFLDEQGMENIPGRTCLFIKTSRCDSYTGRGRLKWLSGKEYEKIRLAK